MKINIYQINSDRDVNRVSFTRFDSIEKFQGSSAVDSSIYDMVYSVDVEANNLDSVYEIFNMNRPSEFTGHSLSVSDIIEVVEAPNIVGKIDYTKTGMSSVYTDLSEYNAQIDQLRDQGVDFAAHDYIGLKVPVIEKGFYFVDSIGFKKVYFEPEKTQEKDVKKIRVVMVEPEKEARIVEIESNLDAMQHAVQGDIEAVYPFEDDAALVVNEEGKITGLPLNRALYYDGEMIDIMAGTFFICAAPPESEHFESLSEEQADKYLKMFKEPERFSRGLDGRIVAQKVKRPLDEAISEYKQSVSKTNKTINKEKDEPER